MLVAIQAGASAPEAEVEMAIATARADAEERLNTLLAGAEVAAAALRGELAEADAAAELGARAGADRVPMVEGARADQATAGREAFEAATALESTSEAREACVTVAAAVRAELEAMRALARDAARCAELEARDAKLTALRAELAAVRVEASEAVTVSGTTQEHGELLAQQLAAARAAQAEATREAEAARVEAAGLREEFVEAQARAAVVAG
eukprot:scaffold107151_cov54-Phaeocystis_antarctica.AAC.2